MNRRIVTAESVTCGHPDKLADLIADAILDKHLEQDKKERVAVEVLLSGNDVHIVGEVTSRAEVDYEQVAKDVIAEVGYKIDELNFHIGIREQSQDISQAVTKDENELGAGDQGLVFGFASDETLNYMPLPIELAHRLTDRLTYCRENDIIKGLLPDGKSQVSVQYKNDRLDKILSVVVSTQHEESLEVEELRAKVKEHVIDKVFEDIKLDETTTIDINPSGRFVLGGFEADTGLTGRKLIVDSYGGSANHGGGAYSGKDPTKVDRSGAYMARYVAKNIVASGLAEKCQVTLSYAIGKTLPTSIDIDTFYTSGVGEKIIQRAVENVFDLRVHKVIEHLELQQPIFKQTAVGGHFGKENLPWEKTDKAKELKDAVL